MLETHAPVIEGRFIPLGTRCNLACGFCGRGGTGADSELSVLEAAVARARSEGRERAIFCGGEPLVHPGIVPLVRLARGLGLKAGVSTNARALASEALARSLVGLGVDAFLVWLCGARAADHDARVGVRGAFLQTVRAVKVLLSLPQARVELRYPLLPETAAQAGDFLALAAGLEGGTGRLYACLDYPGWGLSPREAAEAVAAALARPAGLPVHHEGLPKCAAASAPEASMDRYARDWDGPEAVRSGPGCPNGARGGERRKVLRCGECVEDSSCLGPHREDKARGAFRVRPWLGLHSNSFDYVEEAALDGFRPKTGDCRGWRLPVPGGADRNVFLERDGRVARYRADTCSFSAADLARIKRVQQQLYLDVSDKAALDDFQKDVRQLRLAEECRECGRRSRCALTFRVSEEIPFHREERWLRGELGRMAGRVLDLGCGDLRYQDLIGEGVRAGRVQYHGLDPDSESLEKLKAAGFPMKIFNQGAEDFSCPPGWYDYVLMLRSVNHFRSLKRTFDAVERALRNYGQLIIADSIPLALLRSREKTAAARASLRPRFEHYRNFASQQVLEFLRAGRYPFVVNIHRPVVAKSSNLWLLKLIKIDHEKES